MTSEVIATAVSPKPVARESCLSDGVDHGADGGGRIWGCTATFRALHNDDYFFIFFSKLF